MKHAHLLRNLILAVTDEPGAKFGTPSVEITDEQAATVATLRGAKKKVQLVNGIVSEVVTGPTYIEKRRAAYLHEGVTPEALTIALTEKVAENRSEALDALQAKRAAIKLQFPKP